MPPLAGMELKSITQIMENRPLQTPGGTGSRSPAMRNARWRGQHWRNIMRLSWLNDARCGRRPGRPVAGDRFLKAQFALAMHAV